MDYDGFAQLVPCLLLVGARLLPIVWLTPWLSLERGPGWLTALATLALSLALVAPAMASAPPLPSDPVSLVGLMLREALLGSTFAVAMALPIHGVQWGGQLMERYAGAPQAAQGVSGPMTDGDGPLGQLTRWLAVVVFLAVDGHRLALSVLGDSLTRLPVGELAVTNLASLARTSVQLTGQALAVACLIALPWALVMLTTELVLSLVSRSMPPLSAAHFALPLRRGLLLAMVLLTCAALLPRLPELFWQGLQAARGLMP